MTTKEHKEKIKKLKYLKLSDHDIGVLTCCKTRMHNKHTTLYNKMMMAIDAEDFYNKGMLSNQDMHSMMNGAAIMYHLMTDPEFLKGCENIYEKSALVGVVKTKKK